MKTLNTIKNLLIVLLFFINCFSISGQNWVLSEVINGSNIEPKYAVVDNHNNMVILASFLDTIYAPYSVVSYGARDVFMIKLNQNGQVLWTNRIGNTSFDVAGGVTVDNSDNIYIAGSFMNACRFTTTDSLVNTNDLDDIYLAKYSSGGVFQWARKVGTGASIQSAFDLKFNDDDRLLMTGFFRDSLVIGSTVADLDTLLGNTYVSNFIAAFDMDGNHIWSKPFLGTNNQTRFRRIDLSDNGYYFGGYFKGSLYLDIDTIESYVSTTYDAFVYKTDLNGDGLWVRRIQGSSNENFKSLTTDEYDNVYVLGNYGSTTIYVDSTETLTETITGNTGGFDTFIGKYNRSGILQWFLRKGSSANDIYNDFVVRNNVIFATGYFADEIVFNQDTLRTSGASNEDAFIAAFNQIGDPISGVSIEGEGDYNDAGVIVGMDVNSRAYVSGLYKSQLITIGEDTYTSDNIDKNDLFFAIYKQPFTGVVTDQQNISCHGLSDGYLKVTPYFGRPPYDYDWSHDPSNDQPEASDLAAGDYTITITDENDSVTYVYATITEPDTILVSADITPVACYNESNGEIDITVTGGVIAVDYAYYWTTLDGSGVSPLDEDQTGLTNGTYSVVVEDDNSCSVSYDFGVDQPDDFSFAGSSVTDITPPGNNGAIDLEVSGGNSPYDYDWSGPLGFTSTDEDLSGLNDGGLYIINITDDKNCETDTSFVVNDGVVFIAELESKTDVLCYGESNGSATIATYNGTGPYTYEWSDGPTLTTSTRTGLAADDYTVIVTDTYSSETSTVYVTINQPSSALTPVLTPTDPKCYMDNTGVIDLEITGGTTPYTFLWNTGYTGEDLVNVGGGTYSVTITDAHDCFVTPPSVDLTEPDLLAAEIVLSGQILCYGDNTVNGTANITSGTGSFTYLWDDPGSQITKTAYDLEAGDYSVKVTNEKGCYTRAYTSIPGKDPITAVAELNSPSCPGLSDGSIIPTPAGGTPPYQNFNWSNDVYTLFNLDISSGIYTLTFNDDNFCTHVQEYDLNDPDSVKVLSAAVTDLTCSGYPDGSIIISAVGGTDIFEYSINNGVDFYTDSVFTELAQGNYILIARDENECLSEAYPAVISQSPDCSFTIYDAFSPNGDDKNPVWNIGNIENFPNCTVKIYNIWGIEVFSSYGYPEPWDGTYKGKALPSGTYYYVIDPGNGSKALTGSVNIVK